MPGPSHTPPGQCLESGRNYRCITDEAPTCVAEFKRISPKYGKGFIFIKLFGA